MSVMKSRRFIADPKPKDQAAHSRPRPCTAAKRAARDRFASFASRRHAADHRGETISFEQLEPFAGNRRVLHGTEPGGIATGLGKIIDKSAGGRISDDREHDGDCAGLTTRPRPRAA